MFTPPIISSTLGRDLPPGVSSGLAGDYGAELPISGWVVCGHAARVNLGFRASLVGAADGDGAAPIALSCGDRLYPTQQRSLASTHITHKFTRASATRKDHSPGATINKFDCLQAEHDRQFAFARKPSTNCVSGRQITIVIF